MIDLAIKLTQNHLLRDRIQHKYNQSNSHRQKFYSRRQTYAGIRKGLVMMVGPGARVLVSAHLAAKCNVMMPA